MENSNTYKRRTVSKGLLQFVEPIKESSINGVVKNKIVGWKIRMSKRKSIRPLTKTRKTWNLSGQKSI